MVPLSTTFLAHPQRVDSTNQGVRIMAIDMFLKLDGITGESADHKHKGSIHIESFSW